MAERPTPHSVAVCTLIALHSDPSSLIHDDDSSHPNDATSDSPTDGGIGEHLSKVIRYIVLHDNHNQNSSLPVERMPLTALLTLISGPPPACRYRNASQILLHDLSQTFSSIDSLLDLFAAFRATVAKGVIDGDSAHGVYVRKICLGFDLLGFDAVGRFWESCCDYLDCGNRSIIGKFGGGEGEGNENGNADVSMEIDMDDHDSFDSFPSDEMRNGHQIRSSLHARNNPTKGRNRNDVGSEIDNDDNQEENHPHSNTSWPLAPNQITRSLLQTCHDLDATNNIYANHDNFGTQQDLESQLHQILQENPELTLAHYLRFLNCAQLGERVGALEHFHRYFDYAMIQERKERLTMPNLPDSAHGSGGSNATNGGTNGNGNGPNGANHNNNANGTNSGNDAGSSSSLSNKKGTVVQYVTIVLASLFHKLGNHEMARMATLEAVKVAQQSGDEACLAYALGWLHATSSDNCDDNSNDYGNGIGSGNGSNEGENRGGLLDRASARGMQYNLQSLVAGTSLQRASQSGNRPFRAWESLASATASAAQGMNHVGNNVYLHDVSTRMTGGSTTTGAGRDVFQVMAQQHMVGANLWKAVGRHNLSLATNQLSMHCYDDRMASERLANIVSNIASSVLYGSASDAIAFGVDDRVLDRDGGNDNEVDRNRVEMPSSGGVTEPLCSALDRLRAGKKKKKRQVVKKDNTDLYSLALTKIRTSKRENPNVFGVNCYHSVAQILLEASSRKLNVHACEPYEICLHNYALGTGRGDKRTIVQTWGLSCLLLCQKNEGDAAKTMISNVIIPYCQKHGMHLYHCHFLLQLVMIYFETSPENPTCVIPTLLECLALSEEHAIDPMHASALSLLSRMHFEMDNIERARAIMKAAMPVILQHCHVSFQGESWLILAKCTLSEVKDAKSKDGKGMKSLQREKLLNRAMTELQHSCDSFEKVQDVLHLREVYYLIAQVCNSISTCTSHEKSRISSLNRRNASSQKFLHYNKVTVSSTRSYWNDAYTEILSR